MDQQAKKQAAARAALAYVENEPVIGVGTGSTANAFIEELAALRSRIDAAVASSEASAVRLRAIGIPVIDLNAAGDLAVYVDGADEANHHLQLIKGGGGALTREKSCAAAARRFVCIVDDSKLVERLGEFPLPIEVIPLARSLVARRLAALGGHPEWRQGFVTDNGNHILDVHGLALEEPVRLESELDHLPGVVCNGLFARRPADVLLVAGDGGVETYTRP